MNKIILIGGSPTAGKSHTARRLSEEFKLPWISTDTIRGQMQWIVKRNDAPDLFHHFDDTPDSSVEYYAKHIPSDIINSQNKESKEVWKGVRGIIESDYTWQDFIVEGVAVLPEFVSNFKVEKKLIPIFLIDEDRDRVRNTIFTRGLWDEANKYPDSVKEKEIEWVFAFNEWISKEAKKYNMPVISVDRKDYFAAIEKLIK